MRLKIIMILTVIILLVMSVQVYADTPIPDPPSYAREYWVITNSSTGVIWLFSSQNPITVTVGKYVNLILYNERVFYYEDGDWVLQREQYGTKYGNFTGTMIASNHDIEYEDGSGFFFLRPKVLRLYPKATTTDFGTILRNFSVGLIPLIGLLILAISLKKAWAFLRNQLAN